MSSPKAAKKNNRRLNKRMIKALSERRLFSTPNNLLDEYKNVMIKSKDDGVTKDES